MNRNAEDGRGAGLPAHGVHHGRLVEASANAGKVVASLAGRSDGIATRAPKASRDPPGNVEDIAETGRWSAAG